MPEPQTGRIGGGALKDNLLRQGINLNFANVSADISAGNPLLHLDVNSLKIAVNTDIPDAGDLTIPSTSQTQNIISGYANIDNLAIDTSQITTVGGDISLNAGTSINATAIATDDLKIDFNTISTTTTNSNIELRPDGLGTVNIRSNWNITGNLHATGNIQTSGNLTFGSDDQDDFTFAADVNSDIIPDITQTSDLGSSTKRWMNIYSTLLNGERLIVDNIEVGSENSSLARRHGNMFYVSTLGDDTNVGDHQHGAFRTLKHALDVVDGSTAGPVTVHIFPGEYEEEFPLTVPPNVTVMGEDIRTVIIKPTVSTQSNDAFYLDGESTVCHLTIKDFYSPGYAFKFLTGGIISTRSPYVHNITVITKGSVTSASDPRGFAQGDAGAGAYLDGAVLDNASLSASALFHSVTFITPNSNGLEITNDVRIEWLNCFTYFADKGMYALDSGGGGGEIRSINSANVYGNYGAIADGSNTLMYLIGHNFGYIGSGSSSTNDVTLLLQDQEVVELNNGKVHFVSTDQQGTFRVGDSFFANFTDGTTSFDAGQLNFDELSAIFISTNGNVTYIDGQLIQTGNIEIFGNTITTNNGDLIFDPLDDNFSISANSTFILSRGTDLDRNDKQGEIRYNTDTNLYEGYSTGNLSFNGTYSSDRETSIAAHPTNNTIVLRADNLDVGTFNSTGLSIHGLLVDDILFDNNITSSNTLDTDLNLVRGATNNDLVIDDLLLKDTRITNTSNNNLLMKNTDDGYIKFAGNKGLSIPRGTTAERPIAETGQTRYNTELSQLEIWNGTTWSSVTGAGGDADADDIQELLDLYILVLG